MPAQEQAIQDVAAELVISIRHSKLTSLTDNHELSVL